MDAKKWKTKITAQCKEVGTFRKAFCPAIDTLAQVLAQRDATREEFEASGGASVIEYTNKFGATNYTKSPLLVLRDDLNKSALSYWRDLGLTPAGLKKIDEAALKGKKQSTLEKALSELG